MPDDSFFNESLEQSRVKAAIVSKYFWAWAKIIMPTAKKYGQQIAYIDLFAGPGRYEDETKTTPILILEQAIKDPDMREMLVTIFNDVNTDYTSSLEKAINAIPMIETLKHKPKVYNQEVGNQIVKMFEQRNLTPTLFFVDPWGYKGLSLRLINSVLKDWGCDCIFFFNYNRIHMGLKNALVEEHMNALFGKARADRLRERITPLKPSEKELTIVEEIAQALKEMGGKYVLPFRFKSALGKRTSHHLIFVSKNFKAYHVMKGVMARQSSSSEQGVPSFEYNPATAQQTLLFDLFRPRPLNELKDELMKEFSGQELTMWEIYEKHSVDTPYTDKNYKDALRQLEAENRIRVSPPANKRRPHNGEVSFGEKVTVKFP